MDFEGLSEAEIEVLVKELVVYASGKIKKKWFRRVRLDPKDVVGDALILLERGRCGHTGQGARQRNYARYPALVDQYKAIIDSLVGDETRKMDAQLTDAAPDGFDPPTTGSSVEGAIDARRRLAEFFDAFYEVALDAPDNALLVKAIEVFEEQHTTEQKVWMSEFDISRGEANNLKKRFTRLMNRAKELVDEDAD